MLELRQRSSTGNRQKPSFWSLLWKEKSKDSAQAEDGSSQPRLFRCNNCDLEAPIERLRVREQNPGRFLKYHGVNGHLQAQGKHMDYPECFLEMLLCDDCKVEYKQWNRYDGVLQKRARFTLYRTVIPLFPLPRWARASYWRYRTRNPIGYSTEEAGSLSISWWEVSPRSQVSGTSATAQDLR